MLTGEGTVREMSYNFNTESFVEFSKTEEKQLKKMPIQLYYFSYSSQLQERDFRNHRNVDA